MTQARLGAARAAARRPIGEALQHGPRSPPAPDQARPPHRPRRRLHAGGAAHAARISLRHSGVARPAHPARRDRGDRCVKRDPGGLGRLARGVTRLRRRARSSTCARQSRPGGNVGQDQRKGPGARGLPRSCRASGERPEAGSLHVAHRHRAREVRLHRRTLRPVPYEGEASSARCWKASRDNYGWAPIVEGGNIIGAEEGHGVDQP